MFRPVTMDGAAAEKVARQYLEQQGLQIRYNNYRTRRGEIDIIASDGDTLVFVEVKYRTSNDYGGAIETIGYRKQRRIVVAAKQFLQANGLTDKVSCRFDAICISLEKSATREHPYRVEWLRNAFSGY